MKKKSRHQLNLDIDKACLPDERYEDSQSQQEDIKKYIQLELDFNKEISYFNDMEGFEKFEEDKINPPHYKETCGLELEAIDIIESVLTHQEFEGYCAGNAMKYRLRAGKKSHNIETDIKKAIWYEDRIKQSFKRQMENANKMGIAIYE